MANINKKVNWKKIEDQYRAGLLSIEEIAREQGIVGGTIRYRAKKEGWTRDLTSQMRQRTRTLMVENLAKIADGKGMAEHVESVNDDRIIEQAARTQIEVVRGHQQTLGRGHHLTFRMLDELEATTAHAGELQNLITSSVAPIRQEALRRAVSLSSRAVILRDLASAARTWVQLERQAFNIADDRGKDEAQNKIDDMTAEELRKDILDTAKKIGLEMTDEDLDKGVAQAANGKMH